MPPLSVQIGKKETEFSSISIASDCSVEIAASGVVLYHSLASSNDSS